MFSIRIPYQDKTTCVKFSRATDEAHIEGRTTGLAFKYVHQGSEWYDIGNETLEVSAGSFILLPQEKDFAATASPKKVEVTGICVDFSEDLRIDGDHYKGDELLFGLPFDLHELKAFATQVNPLATLIPNPKHLFAIDKLRQGIRQFHKRVELMSPILQKQVRKRKTQQQLLIRLLRAHFYVEQNYRGRIRLEDIAQYSGLSAHRLQRLFQAVFGFSPRQQQQTLRMQAALELLEDRSLSLSAIAYELGYTDLAAFSNQFQQHFKVRPSTMRNSSTSTKYAPPQ